MWCPVFLGLTLVGAVFSQEEFSYRDQDSWPGKCMTGKAQSPINIDPHSRVDPKLRRLELINYNKMLTIGIGNGVEGLFLVLIPGVAGLPRVKGGKVGRGERYVFAGCSINWGDSIKFGSHHRLGDDHFAGEFTCYHYNEEKYSDIFEAAASSGDKKAILAISWLFKKTSGSGNSKWDEIFNLIDPSDLESIAYPGKFAELELKLTDLIPQGKDYFHYQGSIIVPILMGMGTENACEEVVSWYIMKDTIPITKAQHDQLAMAGPNPPQQNFRYPQKLNKRKVRAYKHHHASRRGYRGNGYKSNGHGFKGHGKLYGSHGPRHRGKGYLRRGNGYRGRGKGYGTPWW